MAERLRQFDFSAQSAITSAESKGRNRYPWSDWFDGDIWKIDAGRDFNTEPLMMERIIRSSSFEQEPQGEGDAPAPALAQRRLAIDRPPADTTSSVPLPRRSARAGREGRQTA